MATTPGTNYRYLDDRNITPVILIRNTNKNGIYSTKGTPKCVCGKAMDYLGTDRDQGHRFRCPPEGCRLNDKIGFTRYCDTEFYEAPEPGDTERLRSVGRTLAMASHCWRKLYRLRYVVERLFNSLKQSRLLNLHRYLHRYRRRQKVELHVALSNYTYAATMLARVLTNDMDNIRIVRLRPPTGGR